MTTRRRTAARQPQHRADELYRVRRDDAIIAVRDLHVEFTTALGMVSALNGVNFDVPRGKVLGVVGESGSGKCVTARAIMQILERPGRITKGSIDFRRTPTGRTLATPIGAGRRARGDADRVRRGRHHQARTAQSTRCGPSAARRSR